MLYIGKQYTDEIISHALEEDPNECCGILSGKDGIISQIYRITNTAYSPYRYLMDPKQQLNAMLDSEKNGWEILAFYHSHTHSPALPSTTDVRMAQESGWLDVYYILVSLEDKTAPQVRTFHITADGVIIEKEFNVS